MTEERARADRPLRYVALGDSYTIGTAIAADGRWPDRLAASVPGLALVANLGVNGYTSGDVIRDELTALARLEPGFVSLLIGVNDVVRRVPIATYEANVVRILDTVLTAVPSNRAVVVTIPDYTVTPAGADYGVPRQQHDGIVASNAVMLRLAAERGIAGVDILDISLEAATDLGLVADDGLHPSAAQYGRWLERITPVVAELLRG